MTRLAHPFAPPDLITRALICRRLGISRWTWARWVKEGKAPAPVASLPGWPKWRRVEIDRFAQGDYRGPGKRTYFTTARQARNEAAAQAMDRRAPGTPQPSRQAQDFEGR